MTTTNTTAAAGTRKAADARYNDLARRGLILAYTHDDTNREWPRHIHGVKMFPSGQLDIQIQPGGLWWKVIGRDGQAWTYQGM